MIVLRIKKAARRTACQSLFQPARLGRRCPGLLIVLFACAPFSSRSAPSTETNPPTGTPPSTNLVHGLTGNYYQGINPPFDGKPSMVRLDKQIAFNWREGSPADGFPKDNFSIRWKGWVEPPGSGLHTFAVASDDGCRLWIDGRQIIDHWVEQSVDTVKGKISLEGGKKHRIRLEYYEGEVDATVKLFWSGPETGLALIPSQALYTNFPGERAPSAGMPWTGITGGAVLLAIGIVIVAVRWRAR